MIDAYNGIPAGNLREAAWLKSHHSNSQGTCVEMARLSDGQIAVRNSRYPEGPALIYTSCRDRSPDPGAQDGDFDHLVV